MKKIARILFYSIGRLAISNKWYGLIAWFYSKVIEEITVEGKTVRFPKKLNDGKIVVLVLSAYAFRGDPECLAASRELRILQIPYHWQARLFYFFYKYEKTCCYDANKLTRYIEDDDQCYQHKKAHREWLYGFLPKLYENLGIKCVISPHIRYLQDVDWGSVSRKIGIPHILISRDSRFTASAGTKNLMISWLKSLSKFEGSHLIVQGEFDRQLCIEHDYVSADRISSLGCIRMDSFLKRVKTAKPTMNSRKKIVFFPFNLRSVLNVALAREESGASQFFVNVNVSLARLAIKNPEIDVIIKPKSNRAPWCKEVDVVFKESGIFQQEIPNLYIEPYLNVQNLILDADVFCGLNTTVLLEAAIAEKPVIIPYFKEIQKTVFGKVAFFKESYYLFDIAESIEDLESLILHRLNNPEIDGNIMEGRKVMFEGYVSSLNCDATEKHVALIKQVVAEESSKDLQ